MEQLSPNDSSGSDDDLPPEAGVVEPARRSVLEEFAARSATLTRTRRLDRVAEEIFAAFAAGEVEARALKGIVLSRLLYRPGEVRGYYDIDVLVEPSKLAMAGGILTELGFQNMSAREGVVDVAGILHAQVWVSSQADFGNVTVDLHWTLDGCRAPAAQVWTALSAEPQHVVLDAAAVPTLPPAGLAFHLALHAAQHGPDDAKAIGDLRRGVQRWPRAVWREASELARDLDAGPAFAAGLRLTPEGTELADHELVLRDSTAELVEIELSARRPRGTFHLSALAEAQTWGERLQVVRHALFPTPAWIRRQYRWSRNRPWLLPLAYLLHLLRSPGWATRAAAFRRELRRRSSGR